MGKVTVIIQNPSMASSVMAHHLQYNSYGIEEVKEELTTDDMKEPDIFVVPDDEEYPDLS